MLELQDVSVRYGAASVLRGVSLVVEQGEIVALLGANGAGKTTTLRAISGLTPLEGGRISFRGKRIDGSAAHAIVGHGIAHVPERRQLFPRMTVEENLHLGSHLRSARAARRETAARLLELFPILADRRAQLAGTLSGGEQQMLAIARGLMMRPRLLMLDEMSLGLAPVVVAELFSRLPSIREDGVTILLVEQNVRETLNVADRAYVLETGQVTLHGPASQLARNDDIRRAYLGL